VEPVIVTIDVPFSDYALAASNVGVADHAAVARSISASVVEIER
jgi:hypothetical protein